MMFLDDEYRPLHMPRAHWKSCRFLGYEPQWVLDMAEVASARVNLRAAEFEVAGTEQFVERMTGVLSDLIARTPIEPVADRQSDDRADASAGDADYLNLGSFLAAKKITHGDIIVAFVYFHTKLAKHATCTSSDLLSMYESAGLPKPGNISRDLYNLMRTDGKGYLSSASRGQYKLTIPGDNYVLKLGSPR
jgi:hypothetical protein